MHGEILWYVHLWAVCVRHCTHSFKHTCSLCGQGVTPTHLFEECPFAMWYALHVHTKLALLIPGLLPSWKHYIPTPWGVWVRHIEDPIILTIKPEVGLQISHQLIHVSPTGHWTSGGVRAAERTGAKRASLIKLLGSLVTTIYTMHHPSFHLLFPMYQEYQCTGGVGSMSLLAAVHPEGVPRTAWVDTDAGELLWPHPILLYLVSQRHGKHVVVQSTFQFTLCPQGLSRVLYWYVNDLRSHWPDTECSCPSLLLVDTPTTVQDRGLFVGTRVWVMKYGYEEHERYITCIDQDNGRELFRKGRTMQVVMQVTLETLGIPVSLQYKHYRLSVTSQSVW